MFPMREIDIFGVFVAPASVLLVLCAAIFFTARSILNRFIDGNRYVYRRPLFDIACFVIFYCIALLTMRMR
jgi:hypothetical protein